jgi:transcriptional regulator with XRE-family HTH domain
MRIAELPGPRLRQLRLSKGLSLADVANRSGTSPSAVHRYENGWGGFELRTLARLAASLGARLEVSLEPLARPSARLSRGQLVRRFQTLFWDLELTADHLDDYPDWVLRRVLQFGDWEDVRLARLFFGDEAVGRAARHRSMDARTRRFWQVVLGRKRTG